VLQIPVPQNRMTPLKTAWLQLYTPITDNLKLDMRMNLKTKKVQVIGMILPAELHTILSVMSFALLPQISASFCSFKCHEAACNCMHHAEAYISQQISSQSSCSCLGVRS
jgi:hypothetical protein